MRFFRAVGAGLFLAMSASHAFAAEPARQTVDWYRTHQQDRESVLQACRNDHTEDNAADCWNATSAAHAALADNLVTTGETDREADPTFYEHDAGATAMMLFHVFAPCGTRGVVPGSTDSLDQSVPLTHEPNSVHEHGF